MTNKQLIVNELKIIDTFNTKIISKSQIHMIKIRQNLKFFNWKLERTKNRQETWTKFDLTFYNLNKENSIKLEQKKP